MPHQHMSDAELFAASMNLLRQFWQVAERFVDSHEGCRCASCIDNCLISAAMNLLGQLAIRAPENADSRGCAAVRYKLEESLRRSLDHWELHRDEFLQPVQVN